MACDLLNVQVFCIFIELAIRISVVMLIKKAYK